MLKLQRTTLFLLLVAMGLGIFVYIQETRLRPQQEAAKSQSRQLFNFSKDDVQAIAIKTADQNLQFERQEPPPGQPPVKVWKMRAPKQVPASDAAVAYLLNLLVNGKSDRAFFVEPAKLAEYGLDKPLATVEIKLKNQQTRQLI